MSYISKQFIDPSALRSKYKSNKPFPHLVLDNFIDPKLLKMVAKEFPDLSSITNAKRFKSNVEVKFASKGSKDIMPNAKNLISYLNSDQFLIYLQNLTGIKESLISDPYLSGGGYHELKRGGYLKVHADYNKHPKLDLDRRVNLLLYINENWGDNWGGNLELYENNNLTTPIISIKPIFNRCVIFNTTSYTYHGVPDKLKCPQNESRRSLALYYFSTGRPKKEIKINKHSTLFVETKGEKFKKSAIDVFVDWTPPIILRTIKRLFNI